MVEKELLVLLKSAFSQLALLETKVTVLSEKYYILFQMVQSFKWMPNAVGLLTTEVIAMNLLY